MRRADAMIIFFLVFIVVMTALDVFLKVELSVLGDGYTMYKDQIKLYKKENTLLQTQILEKSSYTTIYRESLEGEYIPYVNSTLLRL